MNHDFYAEFALIVFGVSFFVFFFIFGHISSPFFDYKEARKSHPWLALVTRVLCSTISAILAATLGLVGYGM